MSGFINKCFKYWNTLRYLKLIQILARVRFFFPNIKINQDKKNHKNEPINLWIQSPNRSQRMLSLNTFDFLNEVHEISLNDWNNTKYSKLWLYNLHYFDDLNSHKASNRVELHKSFINLWIDENLPFTGIGSPLSSNLGTIW